MSQYFLTCIECGLSLELEDGERVAFALLLTLEIVDTESLAGFLLVHRGHPLIFTTKE